MDRLIEIGKEIQDKRLSYNLNIEELSLQLKITKKYLQSIESGEIFKLLPPVYSNGYIKTYANSLGLDGKKIIEELKDQSQELNFTTVNTEFIEHSLNYKEDLKPNKVTIIISLVIGLIFYGFWKLYTNDIPKTPITNDNNSTDNRQKFDRDENIGIPKSLISK